MRPINNGFLSSLRTALSGTGKLHTIYCCLNKTGEKSTKVVISWGFNILS